MLPTIRQRPAAQVAICRTLVELRQPGQFPVDRQLDVEDRDCSPGVRRMQAARRRASTLRARQLPRLNNRGSGRPLLLSDPAIAALFTARNIEEAAKSVGIAPNTLLNWMKVPEFQTEYREARRAAYSQAVTKLQQARRPPPRPC